ncbi:MAG: asparagine synthetase B, partial [Bacteroidota bacterium]
MIDLASGARGLVFMRAVLRALSFSLAAPLAQAQDLLIPMDESQSDHLRAYGAVYWALADGLGVDWLLNYRGGAFLAPDTPGLRDELRAKGVSYETASGPAITAEVETPAANTSIVRLEKAPR